MPRSQAEEQREAAATRAAVVSDLRERGNVAMRAQDFSAARGFYTEALGVPAVPADERGKLLGNRSACFLALRRADLALEDAEEAVELSAGSGKAHYRLGCLQHEHRLMRAATASLRRAVELLPAAAEVRELTRRDHRHPTPRS